MLNKKKLKIGILTRDMEKWENWEHKILKGILEHPDLELSLFIKDERQKTRPREKSTRNFFANVLFALQIKIESRMYKSPKTADTKEFIDKIKNTETADISSDTIKSHNLDIILQLEFGSVQEKVINSARYGVWRFHYGDYATNRSEPTGFWEIANNEPCCGVTLLQLPKDSDSELVIDKAWFNWHRSFLKTADNLKEQSVVLLFKNINKLLSSGKFQTEKSLSYYNRIYKNPTLRYMLKYMFTAYLKALLFAFRKLFSKKRERCWALFIGKGSFLEATLYKINSVSMPADVFWADPFLYEHENQFYVFFENYPYKTKRGKISVGKVTEDGKNGYSVVEVQDILDLNYHLSYPQIIEEDGEIFMMPETSENKRLEIYRCIHFPDKWELYSTAFEGEEVIDTTYFRDDIGDKWLLLNKGWPELHIYKIDNLKLENITPHKLNPVIIDCKRGRNGGEIFKYENEYYRPSQINTHGIYGKGLQISKIKKLTLDEFEDEPVISIYPNFKKGLVGMHHLHQFGDNFVFDGCYGRL